MIICRQLRIASYSQSERCTIVIQLNLAAQTLRSRWRKSFVNFPIFETIASQPPQFGESQGEYKI
jgi:hypothetical protein